MSKKVNEQENDAITPAMELAGLMELHEYDRAEDSAVETVKRIFLAMQAAKHPVDQDSV